ncbi:DUF4079 domain-containing protein [Gloeobacter morelensis]|uniref:DUF4079 domain-containing protein n=1 Tax=Gloeobacter morelensis MG652769 TaxID=2781736 RepID=A0ABY3PRE5_9CYAN|nr:DUF4079 domain-containing protein [Gloeobacter morelensis]UFP96256.1 DUF4079 domain-containing protein [Gloeobacter morelensis MG652769]
MDWTDAIRLLHPILAVTAVFPLLGVVCYFAWQTRQRRLQLAEGEKSKIPATSGPEHVNIARWLAGGVVVLALLGIGRPLFGKALTDQLWSVNPLLFTFILSTFAVTVAAFVLLYRVRDRLQSVVFAGITAVGILVLGFQDGIFRRDDMWYASHFYLGITATLLMIFSLVIVQNIYQDRTGRWRQAHIVLNSIALLLFVGQGITGARDLLEIPLGWQEPYVYKCDFDRRTCASPPVQSLRESEGALAAGR